MPSASLASLASLAPWPLAPWLPGSLTQGPCIQHIRRLRFARDTTFAEAPQRPHRSRPGRHGHTPQHRDQPVASGGGHTNLAAALREMPYEPFSRPLDLPDLVCPGQACTSQWIK